MQVIDLHLDETQLVPGPGRRHGPGHRGGQLRGAQVREVVVLEQHRVVQPEPVEVAAAAPHGVLLQRPQPGRGLSRVADQRGGPRDPLDVPRGQRGDPAETAHDVEQRPLDAEDRGQLAGQPAHRLVGRAGHAVLDERCQLGRALEGLQQRRDDAKTAGDPRLPDHADGTHRPPRLDHARRRDVTGLAEILAAGRRQQPIE